MKKLTLSVVVISTLATSLFAKADRTLVREYMQISGTTQTIESISDQVTAGIAQTSAVYGKKPDVKKIKQLQKIFDPDSSVESVENYMVKNFDNQSIKKIIKFYKTPTGRSLTDASIDALSPEKASLMIHYIADLRENPPTKQRAKIINEFIDALDMDVVVKDLFFEMFDYLNSQVDKSKRMSRAKINQFMGMLSNSFEKQMFLSSLYIYKDISSDELKKAIDYYKSATGKVEKSVAKESMRKMLKDGFTRARGK
jgi:hypothetical protein